YSQQGKEPIAHIAEVSDVAYGQVERVTQVVRALCWLASLGAGTLTNVVRVEVSRQDQPVSLELGGTDTLETGVPLTLNRSASPARIVPSLDHSFPPYDRPHRNFPFPSLINMPLVAKTTPYRENKAFLMAVFLEIMRYNYALNVGVRAGT